MQISLILIGVISANGNFKVDRNGNMECNNGKFKGNISGSSILTSDFNFNTARGDKIRLDGDGLYLKSNTDTTNITGVLGARFEDKNGNYFDISPNGISSSSGIVGGSAFSPSISLYDASKNYLTIDTEEFMSGFPTSSPIAVYTEKENKLQYALMTEGWGDARFEENLDNPYILFEGILGTHSINVSWQSDRKLKKDIINSNVNATDIIKKIQHKDFKWKRNNIENKCGYIAQELEEINPDFIFKIPQRDGTETYQIQENNIIPYITKALQETILRQEEQQKTIEEQNKRIEILENKIKGGN